MVIRTGGSKKDGGDKMTREELIELLAEHYGIERDEETGEFDLDDYD